MKLVFVLGLFALATACATTDQRPIALRPSPQLVERLRTVRVSYQCDDLPVGDVLTWLASKYEFECVAPGVKLETPLTLRLTSVSGEGLLNAVCLRCDLDWRICGERVQIILDRASVRKSEEVRQDLRRREYWISCLEVTAADIFGNLRGYGVPIVVSSSFVANTCVTLELPMQPLNTLLDALAEVLEFRWSVYAGAVHIEESP